jgi:membrane-bound lytic murein transglycosylase C
MGVLSLSLHSSSSDFEKYKQGFQEYKKTQVNDFNSYKTAQEKVYTEYKKELSSYWYEPKLSTKKQLVSYSKDKESRTTVDFKNKKLSVEVYAKSQEEAKQKLTKALQSAITLDTKTFHKTDPLEKKLSEIKLPPNVADGKVSNQPVITTALFKHKPSDKEVKSYVKKHVKTDFINVEKKSKVKNKKLYTLNIALPNNTTFKLSEQYYDDVKKYSQLQKIPIALSFAIMHTESCFNPLARSHIPAYGLMQIVPKTAGIDSYYYLYKEKKLVSGSYLYNSKNNIKMGTAYLHILNYRYLRGIKNPLTRLYCTIAAYNTGAGNIAWAFTHTHNMKKAAPIINSMSSSEVYDHLLANLRYEEPKRYLVKVTKRMLSYQKAYGK